VYKRDYKYTGQDPWLVLDANMYIEPLQCLSSLTYTKEIVSGPRTDLFELNDGSTIAAFDADQGKITIAATDKDSVPPGTYKFEITGSLGDKTHTIRYIVDFVDPCLSVKPVIITNPFED
jgi:hypothetical protein